MIGASSRARTRHIVLFMLIIGLTGWLTRAWQVSAEEAAKPIVGLAINFMGDKDVAIKPEEGAGYISQKFWNNANGKDGSTASIEGPVKGKLVDSTGQPTETYIEWTSHGEAGGTLGGDTVCQEGFGDQTGLKSLVSGNIRAHYSQEYSVNEDAVITLSEIPPQLGQKYDVYVYLCDRNGPDPYEVTFDTGPERRIVRSSSSQGSPIFFFGYDDNGSVLGNCEGYGCNKGEDTVAVWKGLSGTTLKITVKDTYYENEPVGIAGIQLVPAK